MQLTPLASTCRLALVTCLAAALPSLSLAEDKVKLKFADWLPTAHYTSSQGAKVFIEKAQELSKGRLEIQYFPAEQLGKAKDSLSLAQTGVAEIVNIAPAYITEKFPLSGVAELPGIYQDACAGSTAFAALAKPGAILAENEFTPNGVRVLFSAGLGAYRVLTATRKVETAKDFAGLKLRTAGGAMDLTAGVLGANSLRMPGPDVLPSLTRGTLDGVFFPLQSVKPWGLQHALKHMTPDLGVGSFTILYTIGDKAWNKLPKDLQDVLTAAGEYATKYHCDYVEKAEIAIAAELEAGGIKPTPLPAEDLKALQKALAGINAEWATALDKRNKPGPRVLEAFKAALPK